MRDPYDILGVNKSSSAAELKSAYRKLAKKLHPDVNPGRKDIEQKFKEVTAAYDLLSDEKKRARYDRGEIDASGNERAHFHAGGDPFSGMGGNFRKSHGGGNFSDINPEDVLSELFGMRSRAKGSGRGFGGDFGGAGARGEDVSYSLSVPFTEACLGGKRRFTLASGKTVEVNIPQGTEDGHKLRLRGQGISGPRGASGDAIIEIHVESHPHFTRKGDEIHLEVPVSLPEAVLGASIKVPTLHGHVAIKVPKGASSGMTLRLRGKGVPKSQGEAGDMFVKLRIVLPSPVPESLEEFIEGWSRKNNYDPRKNLEW